MSDFDRITREHVPKALEDLDNGVEHGFGRLRIYDLANKNNR